MEPTRIGLIGCGNISRAYLTAMRSFPVLNIVACADIDPAAARNTEAAFGPRAVEVEELLGDPDIEVVLNLTIPAAHTAVNTAALEAGKHAYCEKPFGLDIGEGRKVLELAAARGLRTGCAPDTFLGGGQQTVRALIDADAIGRPVAATAFMMIHGHESWHPNPGFYYEPGGGPLFDMGPYYLTTLVNMLGPVKRVAAISGRGFEQRTIASEAKHGEIIDVEVDTHVAGTLEFDDGAIATVVMSFDVWKHSNRFIEVHGTKASISVPDPNQFGGPVMISGRDRSWQEVPLSHGYTENMRSLGLADMCSAIQQDRPHRCSGELAFHILEVMSAFQRSSDEGRHIDVSSRVERPEPLVAG